MKIKTPIDEKEIMVATRKPRKPVWVLWAYLLMVLLLLGSLAAAWMRSLTPPQTHASRIAHSTFKPVVGDVNDPEQDDPDITVQQSLIPGFQFLSGGYTLSGTVTDAQSGQGVTGAVVWVDLPVALGQRTSIPLHTVTDSRGSYQFLHLAPGSYTVVASRYYILGDERYYAERIFSPVALQGNRSGFNLPLQAIPAPGKRVPRRGQAQNVILIDVRGFYAASLLDDPLLVNETQNMRFFLRHEQLANSLWHPYGWRPLDQYALLTGTYPQWATYDSWPHPVAWGAPDNIDTTYWLTGGRATHLFGQESIFDVAKGYGMQTSAVTGGDYLLSDVTTRNLDVLQSSSEFTASHWLAQVQDAVQTGKLQRNGFLLYAELAPLAAGAANSSPDAQGDDYQQALMLADHSFGQFLTWLGQQGLLQNTLIALTTSQAQANHTDADNFYGMGSTGQGSSKQTLLALAGPGVCQGAVDEHMYSTFSIAPTLMQSIGLPAPTEARLQPTSSLFARSCS